MAADISDKERLITEIERNYDKNNTINDDEALGDVLDEDLDIFDMAVPYQDDGSIVSIADVPVGLTKDELLEAQYNDEFGQTILTRQSRNLDTNFFEGNDGLLRRQHPTDPEIVQTVLPETLRSRVFALPLHTKLAGHPVQTRMCRHICETYYWPQINADVFKTIRNCTKCAKNRVKLRKRTNPLRIFPGTPPLESLAIDVLGLSTKTKKGHQLLPAIPDRFLKLIHVVALQRIDAYTVAVPFVEAWVFKYGPPKTLISDNVKTFAAKLFQAVFSLLGLTKIYTSTYHP